MHLQEFEIFDLHCPLHHVTYVPAKFEVDTAKGYEMHYQENTFLT